MSYNQRLFIFLFIDSIIILLSVIASYLLRFDGAIPRQFVLVIPHTFILFWTTTYIMFHISKLYRRVWQYASVGELISIIRAVTISMSSSFAIYFLAKQLGLQLVIPRSIFLISWMAIILGVGGSRFVWRIIRDSYKKIQPYHKRALIIGAGNAGALVARELKHSPDSALYPVAFIDDDPAKLHLEVVGLPVVGTRKDITSVVEQYQIDTIIIAIPSAPREEVAKVIDICKDTGVQIKLLPRVSDLIDGKVSVKLIRDVNLEDLLGRDPVQVDLAGIAGYVAHQVVLITGAGGSIGSELCRQLAPFSPQKLLLLGHGENSIYNIELELRASFPDLQLETIIADIQDRRRIEEVFSAHRPHVVFHAAAHKHVPLMERNPEEAVKNNIFGTKNIAECAHEYGASHFVLISTDKAVNPTSVMGATKRIAELIVQSLDKVSETRFAAVRFGNVLGSRGSVIPVFKQQIEHGGPVTVTHPDMVRFFMTIPEAVQLVIQAGALAHGGEVFILDMGKPVRIVDLARDLIRLSGLEPDEDIKIIYTGIRPGEKLYEEILTAEEGTAATRHNRIFVGRPSDISLDKLDFILRKLEYIIYKKEKPVDAEEIKGMIKQLVPTFRWQLDQQPMQQPVTLKDRI